MNHETRNDKEEHHPGDAVEDAIVNGDQHTVQRATRRRELIHGKTGAMKQRHPERRHQSQSVQAGKRAHGKVFLSLRRPSVSGTGACRCTPYLGLAKA